VIMANVVANSAIVGDLGSQLSASPVQIMAIFIGLAILPFLLMSITSFVKLSVVFGILRSALGAGQIPSTAISGLLSVVLTVFIMAPIFSSTVELIREGLNSEEIVELKNSKKVNAVEKWIEILSISSHPIKTFLFKHSTESERKFFAEFHRGQAGIEGLLKDKSADLEICEKATGKKKNCLMEGETIFSLLPAFLLTELKEAFAIGFVIFLPFLIIDLVVANLLVGLGMMMVSPVSIALPFKILLFVLCDGWFLLSRGLIMGYLQ
jgi:type III secretion protein R